jgi:hypothetical protein
MTTSDGYWSGRISADSKAAHLAKRGAKLTLCGVGISLALPPMMGCQPCETCRKVADTMQSAKRRNPLK